MLGLGGHLLQGPRVAVRIAERRVEETAHILHVAHVDAGLHQRVACVADVLNNKVEAPERSG